jgi:hypothetical protein
VYLSSCSALSSGPVLIDTASRSSFRQPPDRPNFRRTDWANFQTHLEDKIPFDPELHNGMGIDTCVANFSGAVLKALRHLLPNIARVTTHGLWYRPAFRIRHGCAGSGRSPGTPLWKLRSNACRGRWPAGSTSGETTSGVRDSNPSISKTNRCGGLQSGWWKFLFHLPPPVHLGGIALSDYEKVEILADNLETQFQPVTTLRSGQLLRWLTWHWGLTSWPLPANPS